MDLLIATRSAGKTREIRALFAGSPFTPVFPEDLGLERRAKEADLEIGATYAAHAIARRGTSLAGATCPPPPTSV